MESLESFKKFFEDLGLNIIFIIAGAFGGWIKQRRRKELSFIERLGIVATGAIIANYIGPIIGDWLNVGERVQHGFVFLIGYIGVEILEMLGTKLKLYVKAFNLLKKK